MNDLLDMAEELRREGKVKEAKEVVERFLRGIPRHPRALMLRSRLLFEERKFYEAAEALRSLSSLLVQDPEYRRVARGLERLIKIQEAEVAPPFATESMAQLLARQGYILEALEIYRRLYFSALGETRFWDEILILRDRLEREGSRGRDGRQLGEEIQALDGWMEKRKRGF